MRSAMTKKPLRASVETEMIPIDSYLASRKALEASFKAEANGDIAQAWECAVEALKHLETWIRQLGPFEGTK